LLMLTLPFNIASYSLLCVILLFKLITFVVCSHTIIKLVYWELFVHV
jgi:hypothetical protein